MMDDVITLLILRMNLLAAWAILVVLALRLPVRRLIGPEMAYHLWALVPVAAMIGLFPSLSDFRPIDETILASGVGIPGEASRIASAMAAWLPVYVAGAFGLFAVFAVGEWRLHRLARQGRVGPAVVGVSWPRIVTPRDYEARFDAAERRLIRLHEENHIERQHPRHNRLIAAAQLLGWFNPLVHLAAYCARLDQEIACDAAVMAATRGQRRLYAETLLKAQRGGVWSALACALTHGGRHPLEVRINALKAPPMSVGRYLRWIKALVVLGAVVTVSLWVAAPQIYG